MKPTLTSISRVASLLAPLALAGAARSQMAQQIQPSTAQGMFSNWAVGVSLPVPFSGAAQTQVLIRAPGVAGGQPTAWTAQKFGVASLDHPDYSLPALTANWNLGTPVGTPSVQLFGGTSTGGDVTPRVTSTGVLSMTAENWYALTLSVKAGASGEANSLIRQRGASASSDIYSYYPPGSTVINPVFNDTVRIEYTKEQLGVTQDLVNLDIGTGLISVDPHRLTTQMVALRTTFYFALTNAWLASHPNPVWIRDTDLMPQAVTAADICCTTWNGTDWSTPTIAYPSDELFLDVLPGQLPLVEIDALSVYKIPAAGEAAQDRVVFSLTLASNVAFAQPKDQILVFQRAKGAAGQVGASVSCPTTALLVSVPGLSPIPVSDRVGLRRIPVPPTGQPDELDALCGTDPHHVDLSAPFVEPICGYPTAELYAGPGQLGLTSIRTRLPDPTYTPQDDRDEAPLIDTLHLQVAGFALGPWPNGAVQYYDAGPVVPPRELGPDPVPIGAPYLFTAGTPLTPLSMSSTVPSSIGTVPTRIFARLFGWNPSTGAFAILRDSWVLTVRY